MLMWATNESFTRLRYNYHTFIDSTIRGTPHPFMQCLIVIAYDHGTEVYVPCVYPLMNGKHEYLYSALLHEVVFLMEFRGMPKFITTDFEIALIKANSCLL
ncbi:hypothetical protein HZS_4077 [Henneguya salminicola]|nr:hypothetical protein HZS_4077 [Henneguya salminicola]